MKILITGADGVLGSTLVRELLSRDYEITALIEKGKSANTLDHLPIEKVEGDSLTENIRRGMDFEEKLDFSKSYFSFTSSFNPLGK